MENKITSFRDEYFFLSNFYPCDIEFNYLTYHSAEAAFQAQKCLDVGERNVFTELSPSQAKRRGKQVKLRPDWEDVKLEIMKSIVFQKFIQHPTLMDKLLDTGDAELIEGNNWHDTFWGVCKGKGQNNLGKILMEVRKDIRLIIEGYTDEFVKSILTNPNIKVEVF